MFPESFRAQVRMLLLCNARFRRSAAATATNSRRRRLPWLSRDLLHVVVGWLAAAEAGDEHHLRLALHSFTKERLLSVLQSREGDVDGGTMAATGNDGGSSFNGSFGGSPAHAALPGAGAGTG